MSDWRDAFLRDRGSRRAGKTLKNYRLATKQFEAWLAETGHGLHDLWPGVLDGFLSHLAQKGLSPGSQRIYVGCAKTYLEYCRMHGLQMTEIIEPDFPRQRERIPQALREDALSAYVQIARTVREPYATALILLPLSGLRVGEMCRLRLADVEISPPWVRLLVQAPRDERGRPDDSGENAKSKAERKTRLLKAAKPVIGHYLVYTRPELERKLAARGKTGEPWLFPNQAGNPISSRHMQEHVRRIRAQLGLEHLTPHTLRRTYATILNENGITGYDLMRLMGHQDVRTTQRYVAPNEQRLDGAVDGIDTPWLDSDDDEFSP